MTGPPLDFRAPFPGREAPPGAARTIGPDVHP